MSSAGSDLSPGDHLPPWGSVLTVVAHPDDESFGLGAILAGFADAGSAVAVLCYTHGESSTLHDVPGDLAAVRATELAGAAAVLGVDPVQLADYPDGALSEVDVADLSAHVIDLAGKVGADGLMVFDTSGVTGHPDHARATVAALAAAESLGLPVLGWTVPTIVATALNQEYGAGFTGHDPADIDLVVTLDRASQLAAVACHPSQAVPGSLLWRRLELLGDVENLRWLRPPHPDHQKDVTHS